MLTDDEIQNILVASEQAFRNRKRPVNDLQPAYATKLKRLADQQLNDWCLHGVPARYWQSVSTKCSSIVTKFNLVQSNQLKTYKTVSLQKCVSSITLIIHFRLCSIASGYFRGT